MLKKKRALVSWCIRSPPAGESCHSKLLFLWKNPIPTYNQFFIIGNAKTTSGEGQPSEKQHYHISLIFHHLGKLKNPFIYTAAIRCTSHLPQQKTGLQRAHIAPHVGQGGRWSVLTVFSAAKSAASQGEASSAKAEVLPCCSVCTLVIDNNWNL